MRARGKGLQKARHAGSVVDADADEKLEQETRGYLYITRAPRAHATGSTTREGELLALGPGRPWASHGQLITASGRASPGGKGQSGSWDASATGHRTAALEGCGWAEISSNGARLLREGQPRFFGFWKPAVNQRSALRSFVLFLRLKQRECDNTFFHKKIVTSPDGHARPRLRPLPTESPCDNRLVQPRRPLIRLPHSRL